MMLIFRVPEGKQLEEAKTVPVSIFMKRLRGVPFPRYSLPREEEEEKGQKSSDDEGEDKDN